EQGLAQGPEEGPARGGCEDCPGARSGPAWTAHTLRLGRRLRSSVNPCPSLATRLLPPPSGLFPQRRAGGPPGPSCPPVPSVPSATAPWPGDRRAGFIPSQASGLASASLLWQLGPAALAGGGGATAGTRAGATARASGGLRSPHLGSWEGEVGVGWRKGTHSLVTSRCAGQGLLRPVRAAPPPWGLTHTNHKLTHAHTHTLMHTYMYTYYTHTAHAHNAPHMHTHTYTLKHTHRHTLALTHIHMLTVPPTHTLAIQRPHTPSHAPMYTYMCPTCTLTFTRTLMCTHSCTHTLTHAHTYTALTCSHIAHTQTHTHTCAHTSSHIHKYTHTHAQVHTLPHAYIHMLACTHNTHTGSRAHMHTLHAHARWRLSPAAARIRQQHPADASCC
ncbi:hypothetical protein H1C71_018430, partial [Ictidomys tridecemlineatus]